MAQSLHVSVGPAAGTDIQVGGELVIGRAAGGQGSLGSDPKLSRQHARIRETGDGRLALEDLGSTNGTFLNGQRVTGTRVLNPGDRVQVGSTTLEVAQAAAAPAAPAPDPAAATDSGVAPAEPPAAEGDGAPTAEESPPADASRTEEALEIEGPNQSTPPPPKRTRTTKK